MRTVQEYYIGAFSADNRFIPESHTPEETAYLDAYTTAMEDRIITKEERKLLDTVASTFGLNDKIVKQLEDEYNSTLEEEWFWAVKQV